MNIGFSVVGDVVIDHVADSIHIEPTGSNVGSHHNIYTTLFQAFHRAFTVFLRHVAVQCNSRVAPGFKPFSQHRGSRLGTHEHEQGIKGLNFEDPG